MKAILELSFSDERGVCCDRCMLSSVLRSERSHCMALGMRPLCPEEGSRVDCPLMPIEPAPPASIASLCLKCPDLVLEYISTDRSLACAWCRKSPPNFPGNQHIMFSHPYEGRSGGQRIMDLLNEQKTSPEWCPLKTKNTQI